MFLLVLFQAPLKIKYKLPWLRDPKEGQNREGKEISDFRCAHKRNVSRLIDSIEVSLVWSFFATSRESIAVCLAPSSKLPLPMARYFRLKRWLYPLFSSERAKSSPFRALSEYASKLIDEARCTRPRRARRMLPPGKFLYSSLRAERVARRPSKSFIESWTPTPCLPPSNCQRVLHLVNQSSKFLTKPVRQWISAGGSYHGTLTDCR